MYWEYQVLHVKHTSLDDLEQELNEQGRSGWELVQVLVAEMPMRAGAVGLVMKRRLEERAE